jgi:hypothetical protein
LNLAGHTRAGTCPRDEVLEQTCILVEILHPILKVSSSLMGLIELLRGKAIQQPVTVRVEASHGRDEDGACRQQEDNDEGDETRHATS